MIEFSLPEDLDALEREISRFADRDLRPRMRLFEETGGWDAAAIAAFEGFGVSGLELPEEWGGAGAGALAKAVALEAVARGDAGGLPAADAPGPAAAALLACPDEDISRDAAAAALSGAGRSVLLLATRDRIVWAPGREAPLRVWTSDGGRLTILDASGCDTKPAEAGAFHASGGVSVDLSSARTAGEWTLGADAGLDLRGRARLWPAAVGLGIGAASLDYATAYAKERMVMGRPVAHHQGNAFAIAATLGGLEAARSSVRAAARRIDDGMPHAGLWATLGYLDALDAALAATDLGVQLLGGHGYIEDHPPEKWFREARALAQLLGGRDAALDDCADAVLDAPDPVLG